MKRSTKHKAPRKLLLDKERVRELTTESLEKVAGGDGEPGTFRCVTTASDV